ncbi:H-NS family nucleoid-associated regulatory protein [Maritimibacter sp. HL-12]|jgi:DNA-binding protein H-NS|uniref:H-NS histone family protein n=1 Tax=Maritimibacter sp. HL-12 TaxID=1162418 RepID=UPI000A0F2EF7|nr:H-NS histone family protein [Maritimibacter sp. HL-12]SMH48941.1 DNA-binding protein H-NS [Maritimibacter sp. HL-12]
MKFNLKEMSRRELEKLRGEVEKALAKVADVERRAALEAAKKAAKAHGFSLEELTDGSTAKKPTPAKPAAAKKPKGDGRAKVAPKYRNPNDPEQTWTGRGRAPKWVEAHLAAGGSKDDLLI